MSTGASFNRGGSKQDYPTPWEFIHACEKRFGKIVIDLAASAENTKTEKFFSIEDNSLIQPWHEIAGNGWLNPEFGNITPWAKKCMEESELGAKVLFLTPASIGANWFKNYVHRKALVLALNGRIQFIGTKDPYPKDCILSAFGFGETGFDVWTWPDELANDPMF